MPKTKNNLTDVAGRLQEINSNQPDRLHDKPANEGTVVNRDGETITLGNRNFTKK